MAHRGRALLGALLLACGFGANAAEAYGSYDNFNTDGIDPAKWTDVERLRVVKGNVLRLYQKDFGGTGSDSGSTGVSWGQNLTRPGAVTQIRGVLKVTAFDVTGCGHNGTASRVRARVLGTFFSTGNRVSGSYVGDVLAQISLSRASNASDGPGVMQVVGSAIVCTSSDCNQSYSLGSASGLGTATLGQTVTLAIEWDKPTRTFRFIRDNGAATSDVTYPAHVFHDYAPSVDFKGIGTRTDLATCASDPQTTGSIEAVFDTVSVNKKGRP